VLRLTPKVRQTEALVAPASNAATTALSFSASIAAGRPPRRPRRRAKNLEQKFPLRRGGVHLLGQGTKGDAPLFEIGNRAQQMRQRSAKPVQLPDHQAITRSNEGKRASQTLAIAATTAGPVFEKMTLIDAGGEESVTLQVQDLAVGIVRDPHVADQHVRKTSYSRFSHTTLFRQGLSRSYSGENGPWRDPPEAERKSGVFRQRPRPRHQRSKRRKYLICLEHHRGFVSPSPLNCQIRTFR
jgi:hypothetical protein